MPSGENWDRTDYYYNEAWQCLEERSETVAGEVTPADEDHVKVQWLWDIRYIDAPVLRWRDENDDGDFLDANETLYYCQDANFNVTALVNTSGTVVERYVYDPYGKPTVLDADWSSDADGQSDYANEVLYAGYRFDTETGLYHVRHRAYHPTLGRWMQRDPIGYEDAQNLYGYARAAVLSGVDPFGLSVNIVSHNKYPDEASPMLGLGGYGGIGATVEGQMVTHYEDCCTEDGSLVEKGYVKYTIEVTAHAGLGLGAKAAGFGAAAKGAGVSDKYELSAETTTCGQRPDRYTSSKEETVLDARVGFSANAGPLSVSFSGGTRVYLRLMGAIGGGEPAVFECDLCAETGARWGSQAGGQREEGEDVHEGCIPIVRFAR